MKVVLFGAVGKVGRVLMPALERAGHDVTPVGRDDAVGLPGHDAAVDFTRPDVVRANVERCLDERVPCVVGTTGLGDDDLAALDERARASGIPCFVAPNFALGAVLM